MYKSGENLLELRISLGTQHKIRLLRKQKNNLASSVLIVVHATALHLNQGNTSEAKQILGMPLHLSTHVASIDLFYNLHYATLNTPFVTNSACTEVLHMLARLRLTARHVIPPSPPSLFSKAMSTFNLPNDGNEVPVNLTSDLDKEQLLSFPAFRTWISTLQHSLSTQRNQNHTFHTAPYKLRKIDVQAVDFFGGGRVGFIKLKAEISNDSGEKLPGSVFLRGGSMCNLALLRLFCVGGMVPEKGLQFAGAAFSHAPTPARSDCSRGKIKGTVLTLT